MKTQTLTAAFVLALGVSGAALFSAPALAQETTEDVTGASAGTGGDAPGRQADAPSNQLDMDMNTRYGTRFGMNYGDLDVDQSGTVTFDELYGEEGVSGMSDEDRTAAQAYFDANASDPTAGITEEDFDSMRERLAGQSGTGGNGANSNN